MSTLTGIQCFAVFFVFTLSACKKKAADTPPRSSPVSNPQSDQESPLQRTEVRNGESQGELNYPRLENFLSTEPALFPPEANGEYQISCEDKVAGVNLKEDRKFLLLPKAGEPYTSKVYVWIEGSQFAITFASFTGAKCSDSDLTETMISSSQLIVLCSVTRGIDQSVVCSTKRAIYATLQSGEHEILNKMHFCGFAAWQEQKTYDITGRKCDQGYTDYFADGSTNSKNMAISGINIGDKTELLAMEWNPDSKQLNYFKPGSNVRSGARKFSAGDGRRSVFFTSLNAIFTTPR